MPRRTQLGVRSVLILDMDTALHDYEDAEHKVPQSENSYGPNPLYANAWDRLPRLTQDDDPRTGREDPSPPPDPRPGPRPTVRISVL